MDRTYRFALFTHLMTHFGCRFVCQRQFVTTVRQTRLADERKKFNDNQERLENLKVHTHRQISNQTFR